jgi:hypothetical protein
MSEPKPKRPPKMRYAARDRPKLAEFSVEKDAEGRPVLRYQIDGEGIIREARRKAGHFVLDLIERAFGLSEEEK